VRVCWVGLALGWCLRVGAGGNGFVPDAALETFHILSPMASIPPVITRFAPSPTGHLHVGGARTALFCWAFAKRHGGRFILRIEDTDAARSSDESARGIMEDLAWLGIEWDEGPEFTPRAIGHAPGHTSARTIGGDPRGVGPFFQARRLKSHYDPAIMQLVEQGKAYPAFEAPEVLEAERAKASAAKQNYRYNRASYEKVPAIKDRLRLIESGEPHVIRLHTPHEEIAFADQVLGDVKIAAGELDDFILRRRDGFPMYNFAVVVDDHGMGVTHVLRAQEHLINTPKQLALYRAFGFAPPRFGHMPLIFNMDSTKMSKRDKAKAARKALKDALAKGAATIAQLATSLRIDAPALQGFHDADNDSIDTTEAIARHFGVALPEIEVADFRDAGYQPEAICNFLSLLGWNPGMKTPDGKDLEKFDNAFLAQHFGIERIGKTNGKFDRAKLLSFNADAIAGMTPARFAERFHAWCQEHEPALPRAVAAETAAWGWLAQAVQTRAKTMRDGAKAASFVLVPDDFSYDHAAVQKHLLDKNQAGLAMLGQVRDRLAGLAPFEPGMIHALLEQLAQQSGVGMGGVAQPIRVAMVGAAVSPPLGETLAVLGQPKVLSRLDRCLRTYTV
jgi:glutamyl/glutaminyl-tRNA synthetase